MATIAIIITWFNTVIILSMLFIVVRPGKTKAKCYNGFIKISLYRSGPWDCLYRIKWMLPNWGSELWNTLIKLLSHTNFRHCHHSRACACTKLDSWKWAFYNYNLHNFTNFKVYTNEIWPRESYPKLNRSLTGTNYRMKLYY